MDLREIKRIVMAKPKEFGCLGLLILIVIILCIANSTRSKSIENKEVYKYSIEKSGTVIPDGIIKTENGKIFMTVYKIQYEGKEYLYFEKSGKPVMVFPE